MKKVILFLLLIPSIAFSQKDKREMLTTELDNIVYYLTSKTLAPSDINLPVKSIKILDARFDTSKLGFEIHQKYSNIRIKDFKRIKLQGGIDKSLENFYNDYYKLALKGSTDKLLMVLKTLWIDNIPNVETNEKVRYDIERATYQNIHVKIEYYVEKNDKYYPIKRLDTVYQLTESILNNADFKFKKNDLCFLHMF